MMVLVIKFIIYMKYGIKTVLKKNQFLKVNAMKSIIENNTLRNNLIQFLFTAKKNNLSKVIPFFHFFAFRSEINFNSNYQTRFNHGKTSLISFIIIFLMFFNTEMSPQDTTDFKTLQIRHHRSDISIERLPENIHDMNAELPPQTPTTRETRVKFSVDVKNAFDQVYQTPMHTVFIKIINMNTVLRMSDYGTNGDNTPQDKIFTIELTLPAGSPSILYYQYGPMQDFVTFERFSEQFKRRTPCILDSEHLLILPLDIYGVKPQQQSLQGYVIDKLTRRIINDVSLKIDGTNISTVSDNSGEFNIERIPQGCYKIKASKQGYSTLSKQISIRSDERPEILVIELECSDNKPIAGRVIAECGPYTSSDELIIFNWNSFDDPETGLLDYQIAFGTESNPQAFLSFTSVGMILSKTILAADFLNDFPSGHFPTGRYVFSVRAVNNCDIISDAVTYVVNVDPTAYAVGDELPLPDNVNWEDINWRKTKDTFEPKTHIILIENAKKLLVGDYGSTVSITFHFINNSDSLLRRYNTSSDVKNKKIIYFTHQDNTPTLAPSINIASVGNVIIHYNEKIPEFITLNEVRTKIFWKDGDFLYVRNGATDEPALIVIHYEDNVTGYIGAEIVQVKRNTPDVERGLVDIGSRILPFQLVDNMDIPHVSRNGSGQSSEQCIYQNLKSGPQYGQLWAIRRNEQDINMEVYWRHKGLAGIAWPYELRRYISKYWPENDSSKYQKYVRGQNKTSGPNVDIPVSLNAKLIYQEMESGHAQLLGGVSFNTDSRGWALIQYSARSKEQPEYDWVGFEVVRCIMHDDRSFFDLNPKQWDVGTEIFDGSHQGPRKGYVYEPMGDKYDPSIYEETGQIFAINKDTLEIWWSNLSRINDPEGSQYPLWPADRVQWSSKVVRYNCNWPINTDTIIIARQNGTGVIDTNIYGTDWRIYFQNNPAIPGFNPNDEHAIKSLDDNGWSIFALRDDLGGETTSMPFVLMKFRERSQNKLWRFKLYKVIREKAPFLLREWEAIDRLYDPYEGVAGKKIDPPCPLNKFDYCEETYAVSGPAFEDRTFIHWVKAAGDDGGSAEITMRFYYPNQIGFYPDKANGGPAVGEHIPWLDDRTNVPIDVTYKIDWPVDVPEMKIGQILIEPMNRLPGISGQCSVDIIYQQSLASGGGESVQLLDPIQTREIELTKIPDNIKVEQQGSEKIFVELSLALRNRISYDPVNYRLKLKGIHINPTLGYDYALLNVLSERERDELLSLSSDPGWQNGISALYNIAKEPIIIKNTSVDPYDMLALTSGDAKGTGYVTLVMQNRVQCNPQPISLEIIKVIPELYSGVIQPFNPNCPFDEMLTMRNRNDFAGRTDDYQFEWRYLPDENGNEPLTPPDEWNNFTPIPASGEGAIDITIKGPGLFTLSDNWFICRYKTPDGNLPWSNTWSDWTSPKLAEGWIKRVVGKITPYTQRAPGVGIEDAENRFSSYSNKEVNTITSMISQAGEKWIGNIPLNCNSLDKFGLIQIYETVLGRGINLSIDGLPPANYPPANNALLLVASRIADLYMLLGNEAYADASDPTIAFGTDDRQYGAEATSLHCFMNVTPSMIEEELALLRGRDDSRPPGIRNHPLYNRLIWNFTNGFTGGEVAYALNYNIHDENGDGVIGLEDAQKLFPQGHGDAWGHYLTAIKNYYRLLKHPNYTWNPRSESISVGGVDVTVDYLDERKFASIGAAKVRTGLEIVNLTYRSEYVENPSGQWQGYKDSNRERAWGFSEWVNRVSQGAYFDWIVGNAILPAEDNVHTGIEKIDRKTVMELQEIVDVSQEIQSQLDAADLGLNPLGLANNVIPFDIDPGEIDRGKTHFEQIYERAVVALNNAITVFNHANNSTQLLRRQSDTKREFDRTVEEREIDFKNRLIEIFGYPYDDDIGPGKTYQTGYDGPDLYHYTYVDPSELVGINESPVKAIPLIVKGFDVKEDGSVVDTEKEVIFHFSTSANRFGLIKPNSWTRQRRAPGEIQLVRSDLIQGRARFESALVQYNNLIANIEDQANLLKTQFNLNSKEINVLNAQLNRQRTLDDLIAQSRSRQLDFRTSSRQATIVANALSEALPIVAGFATDFTSVARSAIQLIGSVLSESFSQDADRESLVELDHQQAMQFMQAQTNIVLTSLRSELAVKQQLKQLEQLMRQEVSQRLELYTMQETLQQVSGKYMNTLARGQRLLEDRTRFRRQTAGEIHSRRYKDMAFRIFRNDALQKYRAQFDLAARYVFLAAKAYDYETTFLSLDPKAGEKFLTDIVRERLIGNIQGGIPETGEGLSDPMKKMSQNFEVLKGQLGFNNPDKETNRFSLRSELFRIQPGLNGNSDWRETLWRYVVPNLSDVPEFKRFCRFSSSPQALEPAIIIPFETNINLGLNYFGWPLGGGDNAYNSSNFTTKIRSVGVWFSNYNNLGSGMSNTPQVYLIPIGIDIQRSPTGQSGDIRSFEIFDQVLPIPYPNIGVGDLNNPNWIPGINNLTGTFAALRKYPSFRAYHDGGDFNITEVIRNSRLIGRSVWNTRWLLIIPAGTLNSNREEGLKRFIDGILVGDKRDGNGVSDIKIFFETYAFPGY